MKAGTQIAYLPDHAAGRINHPDVEFGFVTSERKESHFCRYWIKNKPGTLRTTANSELTHNKNLMEWEVVNQEVVDLIIKKMESEVENAQKPIET
jgi:hypothetical protein